jgi:hypothetical protein
MGRHIEITVLKGEIVSKPKNAGPQARRSLAATQRMKSRQGQDKLAASRGSGTLQN